jgi:hypothetical protein
MVPPAQNSASSGAQQPPELVPDPGQPWQSPSPPKPIAPHLLHPTARKLRQISASSMSV